MTTSTKGREFIKYHEGLRLGRYTDIAGVQTIGYGHTGKNLPRTITKAQAEEYFNDDVKEAEKPINALHVDFTAQQFDALVDFVYNLGEEKFGKSQLRKYIIDHKDTDSIAKEFMRWRYAKHKEHRGLKYRRENEVNLYCNNVYVNCGV